MSSQTILPSPSPEAMRQAILKARLYSRLTDSRQTVPGRERIAGAVAQRLESGKFDSADAALLPTLLERF